MKKINVLLIFCFLTIGITVKAQDTWINCLAGVHINDVVDTESQTLIATTGGLVVYSKGSDETRFYNRGNSNIPSNFVSQVEVDYNGNIWIQTHIGFSEFLNDQFHEVSMLSGILTLDQNGDFVIANTFYIYTWNGATFDSLNVESNTGFLIESGIIFNSEEDELWMSQYTFGIFEVLRYKNGIWSSYDSSNSVFGFESPNGNSFSYDNNNDLWITTYSGLYKFENEIWVDKTNLLFDDSVSNLIDIVHLQNGNSYILSLYANADDQYLIYELDVDENVREINYPTDIERPYPNFLTLDFEKNAFFLGTRNQGCYRYSDETWTKIKISDTQLSSNTTQLAKDMNGTMYFSTGNNFSFYLPRAYTYESENWSDISANIPQNSSGFRDYLIMDGLDGEVFMAANDSLYIRDGNQWLPVELPELSSDVEKEENSRIHYDKNGNRWLFNLNTSYIFQENGESWNAYIYADHGANIEKRSSIINHPTRNEIIVSNYSSIAVFNLDTNEWSRYNNSDIGLSSSTYFSLVAHTDGNVYGINNQLFFKFSEDYNAESIAIKDSIYTSGYENRWSAIQSIDGDLWLGMSGGVAQYDLNEFTVYDRNNSGITNSYINNIHLDNNNNIWFGSEQGGLSIFNVNGITEDLLDKGGLSMNTDLKEDVEVSIYPNPTSGSFVIDSKGSFNKFNVTIYDQDGKKLRSYNQVSSHQWLGLHNLNSPYYIIQIVDTETQLTVVKKLVTLK